MNERADHSASLMEELGFPDGLGYPQQKERLFVWRFFLAGGELPEWRLHRSYRIPGGPLPPCIQSIWTRGSGDELLRVDAFETTSAAAARDTLVALAGQVEARGALKRSEGVGEVALAGAQENSLALVRGNLVISVRNAGRIVTPIRAQAAALDDLIAAGPAKAAPGALRVRSARMRPADLTSLAERMSAAETQERPAWFRFRTRDGEIVLENGRPVFHPDRADVDTETELIEAEAVQPGAERSEPDLREFDTVT